MSKRKNSVKQSAKQKRTSAPLEARNAFRLLQHTAKLCEDEITGDLDNLPITITYGIGEYGGRSVQIDSHFDLVQYVLQMLMMIGISLDDALSTVFSAKTTREVMKGITKKPEAEKQPGKSAKPDRKPNKVGRKSSSVLLPSEKSKFKN